MSKPIPRPLQLQINAFDGEYAVSSHLPPTTRWAQEERGRPVPQPLGAPPPADLRDWAHPDVGWGLVLPDNDTVPFDARARGEDAPQEIRKLLANRANAPVLRWRRELQQSYLRRYYADGKSPQDLSISAPKPGTAHGCVPRYLLIYATPDDIPWAVQYALNMSSYVGRLVPSPKLEGYFDALIDDWSGYTARPQSPLVWSVDFGRGDITWLMARAVAGVLAKRFESDTQLTGRRWLKDEESTRENLSAALNELSPGLVVTTSHGMTGPLTDKAALSAQLGLPIDANHVVFRPEDLGPWKPSGAIWYAHACCSAGSDSVSRYATLLPSETEISRTLNGVAMGAGAVVAPLPTALLTADAPARAFVGHVEPTFDWTLRDPSSGEVLTNVLCSALYNNLYQTDRRSPLGWALRNVFAEAGAFYGAWQVARAAINKNQPGARDWALYRQLVAMDRQTLVVIGDPTVSLPLIK